MRSAVCDSFTQTHTPPALSLPLAVPAIPSAPHPPLLYCLLQPSCSVSEASLSACTLVWTPQMTWSSRWAPAEVCWAQGEFCPEMCHGLNKDKSR